MQPIIFLDIDGVLTTPASGWKIVPVEMDIGLTEDNVEDAISILLGLKPKPSFFK